MVSYYGEDAREDVKIPMGICKKVAGCRHLHTAVYAGASSDHIRWATQKVDGKTVDVLYVEGILRENPYLIKKIESDSSDSSSSSVKSSSTSSSNDSESYESSAVSERS